MKRIEWADGLKGICCLLIVIHHYLLLRFPSAYYGISASSFLNGYDTKFAQSPLSVFVNGNTLVCLFFLLSSVIMCLQTYNICHDDKKVAQNILKRYFRFALPIFMCSIMSEFFMRLLEGNSHSFIELLRSSFITVIWKGDNTFNNVFWVLSITFIGSFISMLFGFILKNSNKRIILILFFMAYVYFFLGTYYLAFMMGIIIAYFMIHYCKNANHKNLKICIGILCIFLGLFVGGYPTEFEPMNIYKFLNISWINSHIPCHVFWHIMGSFLFCIGICMLPIVQKFLSLKGFRFLGKISFYVYTLHDISRKIIRIWIPNISSFLGGHYFLTSVIGLVITLLLSISFAYIFTRFIQKYIDVLIQKIINFFSIDNNVVKEG